MAFEQDTTTGTEYFKVGDLNVGDSIMCYILGAVKSSLYDKYDLKVKMLDGTDKVLSTSGSLKYYAIDIFEGKKECGFLTRITRMADKVNSRKQVVRQFKVEIDKQKPSTMAESRPTSAHVVDKTVTTGDIPF